MMRLSLRLELAEGGGMFFDSAADVHQWTDGDERNLAGVAANLVKEKGDRLRMGRLGEMAGFGVAALGEGALGGRGNAGGYRDVRTSDFGEEAVEELGASFCIAESRGNAENLQFGAVQRESHGESVVDVIPNVGVDDDFFGGRWSGLG